MAKGSKRGESSPKRTRGKQGQSQGVHMEDESDDSADSTRSDAEIRIDIPGVTPSTKLADLTVEQFVQLVVQVGQHVQRPRTRGDRRKAETVRRLIRILGSDNENVVAIRSSLSEAAKRLPQIMRDLAKEVGEEQT